MKTGSANNRVFLAGATGAIGKRLVPVLVRRGWKVFGTTRSAARAQALEAAGVQAIVLDVFDAPALLQAVARVRPEVVVHQLTDLPPGLDPVHMGEAVGRNARVRMEGTANLVAAALAARVPRMVAQSIAWAYRPGPEPHCEQDPLDLDAEGTRATTVRGVADLERLVLQSPPMAGTVLRYGLLYGPGTGADRGAKAMPLHVDAAAWAALLAVERGEPGIYNIAEPGPRLETGRAHRILGWSADWRLTEAF